MFIGNKKVKGTSPSEKEGYIFVNFKDAETPQIEIKQTLYDMIVKDYKGRGNITDAINHIFSTKFLTELSEYGLEYYFIGNIARGMETLAHNVREQLFKSTFNCSGADAISLELMLKQYEESGKQTDEFIKEV